VTVERFVDDDRGFQRWLAKHWQGLVVNAYRKPTPDYLVLHKTDCDSLTRHEHYTTHDYIKVCSDRRFELETWAKEEVGSELTRCGECNP
jgi:hypothetical protein